MLYLLAIRVKDGQTESKGVAMSDNIAQRTQHQQRVDEFMKLAGQASPDRPTIPDFQTRLLRARLILEEALEAIHALGFDVRTGQMAHDSAPEVWKPNELVEQLVQSYDVDFEPSLAEIADGCSDLVFVTTGTFSSCGMAAQSIQEEVDKNNLAKFEHRCSDCGSAESDSFAGQKAVHGGVYNVGVRRCPSCRRIWQSGYRRDDGKWVKPENHKAPDLKRIVSEQIEACQK